MPLPAVSFLVGLAVVLYLSTFILFALLRIITGVSVQRVGYTGFRRIAFFPRDGIKVHIRGISLSVHRPTFAQPTWLSLNLTELQIFVDLRALNANKRKGSQDTEKQNGCKVTPASSNGGPETNADNDDTHGRTWKKLTKIKETVKRLHRKIKWIRLVDLVATGSTVVIRDVGTVRVERFNLSVDTRVQTVDRSRLFQHQMTKVESQTPAEWKSIVRSILFTPEGKESTEILDYCTFNVHGFLHKELDGLRDASIAWKLGRLTVPYDDLDSAIERVRDIRNTVSVDVSYAGAPKISINDVFQQDEDPDSRDENIMQTISDSKEFASSILRGIQEIQLAVGFFGLSKRIKALHTSGQHVYFNLAMKEVGFDLLRLDSRSPAHRMYFSPKDVAHQALLTAISIAAGVDDGHEHPERMLYVPMVTATVKTTLPSKTVQYVEDAVAHDRNTNILFANFVCTSPSVDLDPKHLPLLLAILQSQRTPRKQGQVKAWHRRDLVSRLLPKASVKLSIQEPVVRVSLPPMDASRAGEGDYDLLISSTSTMAWEIEASHATEGQSHYGLVLNYRQTSQRLYYQASTNEKHDLLDMDTVEVKVEASTLPETNVLISGKFQTFSAFLVRPDICEGVRQIMKSVRKDPFFSSRKKSGKKPSFLRQMPSWLQHCQLQGSDFNLEIAGVDDKVSKYSRGFALHLESWSAEYKAHREEVFETAFRRRSVSRPPPKERPEPAPLSGSPRSKKLYTVADGRRLAIHIEGLEGLIIDSLDSTGADPFMALPRFEVAFSTSTDQQGPIFHINSHAKSFMVNYSLYNHFSIGVASTVIKRTFIPHSEDGPEQKQHHPSLSISQDDGTGEDPLAANEITTVDFKASLIQLKAQMPADPPLMIQRVWSRIVSAKSLRVDLREIKRKSGKTIVAEKSIDVGSEAIRFVVPHQLVVHDIFDNITTAVKTAQQLHHHFYTGSANFNATKEPEPPKHVPKINLRCQVLMFEIEDSSFEWKLSTIYRSGLIEQKQRLAREEAFRLKVKNSTSKANDEAVPAPGRSQRTHENAVRPDLGTSARSAARSSITGITMTHLMMDQQVVTVI
ncbi:Protein SABRE [Taxawa tesnikishii (nom. ined.)]|nr:Protein SABRE [Dothideales sp. JES 119]